MNYTSLLLKKIYKNKLNIIPFLLFMGFIIFMYSTDRTAAYTQMIDPNLSGEASIVHMEERIAYFENIVNNENNTTNQREHAQKNLEIESKKLNNIKKRLDAFSKEDWAEYYKSDLAISEARLEGFQTDKEMYNEERINSISVYIGFDQHMLEYGNGFDHPFCNIQGISYMTKVYRYFIALFLSIIMIYITSRVYCSTNIDKMDIQNLLPISPFKKQCSKLCVGVCVGLGSISFFSIIALLCGTMGVTIGNLNSPVYMYAIKGGGHFVSFIDIIPQLLILMVLVVGFITNVILCISLIFRKGMTCMLLSLVVIFGGFFALPNLAPMGKYLHLIPTTYINFFNALTGKIAFDVQNIGVNFTNGCLVLIISNVILMATYYIITRIRTIGIIS